MNAKKSYIYIQRLSRINQDSHRLIHKRLITNQIDNELNFGLKPKLVPNYEKIRFFVFANKKNNMKNSIKQWVREKPTKLRR